LVLVHQCSASAVSMYIVTANLFSAEHVFASKILSRSFSHWSAASGLVFPLHFTGWCFRKSYGLYSLTGGGGCGLNTGAVAFLFQLAEGLHMLPMCILGSHTCNLHLLHHCLLLLKRHRLSLHRCLMLLHYRCALLRHGSHHRLYCPGDIGQVTLGQL